VPDGAVISRKSGSLADKGSLLTAYETRAIPTAEPAPGSADLIMTARQTGRTVTIVSNNSGAAVAAYLADHQLTGYVRGIGARDDDDRILSNGTVGYQNCPNALAWSVVGRVTAWPMVVLSWSARSSRLRVRT
jgi:hypothetical protein